MRIHLCAFLLPFLLRRFTFYRCAFKTLLIIFAQGRVLLSRILNLIINVCANARLSVARFLFLNYVNYNCARIHFSVAHFGLFNCCAFWVIYILWLRLYTFICGAFWPFQLLRLLNKINYDCACAPSSGAHSGPYVLPLRKCAFFYCAFWTTLIILAHVRGFLLRISFLIVHPSSIDQGISFLRLCFAASIVHWSGHSSFFCASLLLCIHHSSIRAYCHCTSFLSFNAHPSFINYGILFLHVFFIFLCASIFH